MKKITYLNGVLTIIAFCLLIITFNLLGFIPKAYAGGPTSNFSNIPVNKDGSINVKIVSDVIEVDITDISTSDELKVDIDEIGGYSVLDSKIPVRIER